MSDGNRMRWDCNIKGCFNRLCRPKIEQFADCFPGRINFGDVDGEVEIGGFFCQLEWKSFGAAIRRGQQIKFERLTSRPGNVVFVVEGNAETMQVDRYCCFANGRQWPWRDNGMCGLKQSLKTWVSNVG